VSFSPPVVASLPLCFEKAANKQKARKEVRSGRPLFEFFFLARGSRISPLQDGPIRAPTLTRRHPHEPPVSASVEAGRNSSLRYEACLPTGPPVSPSLHRMLQRLPSVVFATLIDRQRPANVRARGESTKSVRANAARVFQKYSRRAQSTSLDGARVIEPRSDTSSPFHKSGLSEQPVVAGIVLQHQRMAPNVSQRLAMHKCQITDSIWHWFSADNKANHPLRSAA
jgi:hypothetical protein